MVKDFLDAVYVRVQCCFLSPNALEFQITPTFDPLLLLKSILQGELKAIFEKSNLTNPYDHKIGIILHYFFVNNKKLHLYFGRQISEWNTIHLIAAFQPIP